MIQQFSAVVVRERVGPVVPTGWELLALVKWVGDIMLREYRHGSHSRYLDIRSDYLALLDIAQHDAICAPILINQVQRVFDEEHARSRV